MAGQNIIAQGVVFANAKVQILKQITTYFAGKKI